MFTAWITLNFKFAVHFSRFSKLIFLSALNLKTVPTGTLRNPSFAFNTTSLPNQRKRRQLQTPRKLQFLRKRHGASHHLHINSIAMACVEKFIYFYLANLESSPLNPSVPTSSLDDCLLLMIILGYWNRPKSTAGPDPSSNKPALTTLNLF